MMSFQGAGRRVWWVENEGGGPGRTTDLTTGGPCQGAPNPAAQWPCDTHHHRGCWGTPQQAVLGSPSSTGSRGAPAISEAAQTWLFPTPPLWPVSTAQGKRSSAISGSSASVLDTALQAAPGEIRKGSGLYGRHHAWDISLWIIKASSFCFGAWQHPLPLVW